MVSFCSSCGDFLICHCFLPNCLLLCLDCFNPPPPVNSCCLIYDPENESFTLFPHSLSYSYFSKVMQTSNVGRRDHS